MAAVAEHVALAVLDVEIVIPVYNEQEDLARSVLRLHEHLETFPFTVGITIADNASTDATWLIARELARGIPGVRAVRLAEKGRGRALRAVWEASEATVVAYMDVDLSTDLNALLPLVAPLLSGHSDIAIGSRLTRGARVTRGPKRELISRSYNLILHLALRAHFSDAQCGFKAMRSDCARALLPHVEDTGWFFDTELLVLAQRSGRRIHEVPVDWVDDPDSRVDVIPTALADLRGVLRLLTHQGATVSATIAPPTPETTRPRMARVDRERSPDPRRVRGLLIALLALTGALYLWRLSASGYANEFYAAAVQSGTQSWKAFFYGSLDPGNAITVDKPPASLWVMELSGRIFGFSSWSMLVPQALEGVAAVGLLYATVRRTTGAYAGLVAGALLALTPVAALMFRFDNPDALLTLLLVAGAYCVTRALERAGTRWIALAGVALGLAFLTKMLQGFLVLPAFGLVYLLAAPTTLLRRVRDLAVGLAAIAVSAGWWVAIVELVPAGDRPYVGGSTDNSILGLTFGYNGLTRLTGNSGGGGGGGGGGGSAMFGGPSGITRLFGDSMGTQIAWLLPAALVAIAAMLWLTRRRPRTDGTRAAIVLWGGWLLVSGLVFSFMNGTVHPYYTVALAPAIAALVAIGGRELWIARDTLVARVVAAATLLGSAIWASVLLDRASGWHPELRVVVLAAGALSAALILLQPLVARRRGLVAAIVVTAAIALVAAPASFALQTASTAHTGSTPTAGPATAGSSGGFGGGNGPGGGGFGGGGTPPSGATRGGTPPTGTRPTGTRGFGGGGASTTTSAALVTLLKADTTHRWAAATVGSQSAAPIELSSGKAVIAIGGFTGSDNSPTLAQFEAMVARGQIHYFIAGNGNGGGPGGGGGTGSAITSWVEAHYTATTVGGQTIYDLTKAAK